LEKLSVPDHDIPSIEDPVPEHSTEADKVETLIPSEENRGSSAAADRTCDLVDEMPTGARLSLPMPDELESAKEEIRGPVNTSVKTESEINVQPSISFEKSAGAECELPLPLDLTHLANLYINRSLENVPCKESEFLVDTLSESSCFIDSQSENNSFEAVLQEYIRFWSQWKYAVDRFSMVCSEAKQLEKNLWTIKHKNSSVNGKCKDGYNVSLVYTYQEAELNENNAQELLETEDVMRWVVFEELPIVAYSLARLSGRNGISEACNDTISKVIGKARLNVKKPVDGLKQNDNSYAHRRGPNNNTPVAAIRSGTTDFDQSPFNPHPRYVSFRNRINEFILDALTQSSNYLGLSGSEPAQLLPSVTSEHEVQLRRLRSICNVLFAKLRQQYSAASQGAALDPAFTKQLRNWISLTAGTMIRVCRAEDHLFILMHLLRLHSKQLRHLLGLLNPPDAAAVWKRSPSVVEFLHQPEVELSLTLFAVCLRPVRERGKFVTVVCSEATGSGSPSATVELPWVVVDSAGESDLEDNCLQIPRRSAESCEPHTPPSSTGSPSPESSRFVSPRDLDRLLKQLNFGKLIQLIAYDGGSVPGRDTTIEESGLLTLLAFANRLLGLIESCGDIYSNLVDTPRPQTHLGAWRVLAKRLARLICLLVTAVGSRMHHVRNQQGSFTNPKFAQTLAQYDAFCLRAAQCLLFGCGLPSTHKGAVRLVCWRHLASLFPFGMVATRSKLRFLHMIIESVVPNWNVDSDMPIDAIPANVTVPLHRALLTIGLNELGLEAILTTLGKLAACECRPLLASPNPGNPNAAVEYQLPTMEAELICSIVRIIFRLAVFPEQASSTELTGRFNVIASLPIAPERGREQLVAVVSAHPQVALDLLLNLIIESGEELSTSEVSSLPRRTIFGSSPFGEHLGSQQLILSLVAEAPLHIWRPDCGQISRLIGWLVNQSPTSFPHLLTRIILHRLNWEAVLNAETGESFLPFDSHLELALALAQFVDKHLRCPTRFNAFPLPPVINQLQSTARSSASALVSTLLTGLGYRSSEVQPVSTPPGTPQKAGHTSRTSAETRFVRTPRTSDYHRRSRSQGPSSVLTEVIESSQPMLSWCVDLLLRLHLPGCVAVASHCPAAPTLKSNLSRALQLLDSLNMDRNPLVPFLVLSLNVKMFGTSSSDLPTDACLSRAFKSIIDSRQPNLIVRTFSLVFHQFASVSLPTERPALTKALASLLQLHRHGQLYHQVESQPLSLVLGSCLDAAINHPYTCHTFLRSLVPVFAQSNWLENPDSVFLLEVLLQIDLWVHRSYIPGKLNSPSDLAGWDACVLDKETGSLSNIVRSNRVRAILLHLPLIQGISLFDACPTEDPVLLALLHTILLEVFGFVDRSYRVSSESDDRRTLLDILNSKLKSLLVHYGSPLNGDRSLALRVIHNIVNLLSDVDSLASRSAFGASGQTTLALTPSFQRDTIDALLGVFDWRELNNRLKPYMELWNKHRLSTIAFVSSFPVEAKQPKDVFSNLRQRQQSEIRYEIPFYSVEKLRSVSISALLPKSVDVVLSSSVLTQDLRNALAQHIKRMCDRIELIEELQNYYRITLVPNLYKITNVQKSEQVECKSILPSWMTGSKRCHGGAHLTCTYQTAEVNKKIEGPSRENRNMVQELLKQALESAHLTASTLMTDELEQSISSDQTDWARLGLRLELSVSYLVKLSHTLVTVGGQTSNSADLNRQGLRAIGLSCFEHLCQNLTGPLLSCPVSKKLIADCIQQLAGEFLTSVSAGYERVLDLLVALPHLSGILQPAFIPPTPGLYPSVSSRTAQAHPLYLVYSRLMDIRFRCSSDIALKILQTVDASLWFGQSEQHRLAPSAQYTALVPILVKCATQTRPTSENTDVNDRMLHELCLEHLQLLLSNRLPDLLSPLCVLLLQAGPVLITQLVGLFGSVLMRCCAANHSSQLEPEGRCISVNVGVLLGDMVNVLRTAVRVCPPDAKLQWSSALIDCFVRWLLVTPCVTSKPHYSSIQRDSITTGSPKAAAKQTSSPGPSGNILLGTLLCSVQTEDEEVFSSLSFSASLWRPSLASLNAMIELISNSCQTHGSVPQASVASLIARLLESVNWTDTCALMADECDIGPLYPRLTSSSSSWCPSDVGSTDRRLAFIESLTFLLVLLCQALHGAPIQRKNSVQQIIEAVVGSIRLSSVGERCYLYVLSHLADHSMPSYSVLLPPTSMEGRMFGLLASVAGMVANPEPADASTSPGRVIEWGTTSTFSNLYPKLTDIPACSADDRALHQKRLAYVRKITGLVQAALLRGVAPTQGFESLLSGLDLSRTTGAPSDEPSMGKDSGFLSRLTQPLGVFVRKIIPTTLLSATQEASSTDPAHVLAVLAWLRISNLLSELEAFAGSSSWKSSAMPEFRNVAELCSEVINLMNVPRTSLPKSAASPAMSQLSVLVQRRPLFFRSAMTHWLLGGAEADQTLSASQLPVPLSGLMPRSIHAGLSRPICYALLTTVPHADEECAVASVQLLDAALWSVLIFASNHLSPNGRLSSLTTLFSEITEQQSFNLNVHCCLRDGRLLPVYVLSQTRLSRLGSAASGTDSHSILVADLLHWLGIVNLKHGRTVPCGSHPGWSTQQTEAANSKCPVATDVSRLVLALSGLKKSLGKLKPHNPLSIENVKM
ncbi:hypothetical protein CLF_112214, partial [Clonorchis sinensis]